MYLGPECKNSYLNTRRHWEVTEYINKYLALPSERESNYTTCFIFWWRRLKALVVRWRVFFFSISPKDSRKVAGSCDWTGLQTTWCRQVTHLSAASCGRWGCSFACQMERRTSPGCRPAPPAWVGSTWPSQRSSRTHRGSVGTSPRPHWEHTRGRAGRQAAILEVQVTQEWSHSSVYYN